jgi:hypothetical protein
MHCSSMARWAELRAFLEAAGRLRLNSVRARALSASQHSMERLLCIERSYGHRLNGGASECGR